MITLHHGKFSTFNFFFPGQPGPLIIEVPPGAPSVLTLLVQNVSLSFPTVPAAQVIYQGGIPLALNKVEPGGTMLQDVTHTWNPLRLRCLHKCIYCYVKRIPGYTETHSFSAFTSDRLGKYKVIFVCSTSDLFGAWVPDRTISEVLHYCRRYPFNVYLFLTKNPDRYWNFLKQFPPYSILGVTIESDRILPGISKAPSVQNRFNAFKYIPPPNMVCIEPIIDFDLQPFLKMLKLIAPTYVVIGAVTGGISLPEPEDWKISRLIEELSVFTELVAKDNLKRLLDLEPIKHFLTVPDPHRRMIQGGLLGGDST